MAIAAAHDLEVDHTDANNAFLNGTINEELYIELLDGDKFFIILAIYVDDILFIDSRRNTSGYVFFLGNSCISWRSSKQTAVALSTAKTKYVAATTATQELLFLKTFLTEIGYPINKTTTLYSDSQSAIANTKNIQLRHASNKHMDIKLHFLRDQVKLGNVNLKYINTLDQVADILTKGLPKPAFCKLANLLGLLPLRVEEGC
ncbi:hypothetical protein BASA50_008688 [Batrachochytrium salamandrivorans]|uniref:Reverse transcriptase Ty1/copia-type domain-containing protein n=1 Tax=Batrachochytrium salamandrivorans TaxID=1357716 RepID=A0ABQ8F3K4_9FUNG|nr:hypothetical protein BASA50_008688 [Batrachochytrium salamandrivorans]